MTLSAVARFFARAIPVGLMVGVAALLVDDLLAWTTLGYRLPFRFQFLLWYAATGLAASLLLGIGYWLIRRRGPDSNSWEAWPWLAASTAGVYVPAIAERAFTALNYRASDTTAWLGLIIAVAGYALWTWLLAKLAGPIAGPWISAVAIAVALAVNRNIIDLPTEPLALLTDALVIATALAAAIAARKLGGRPIAWTAVAAVVLLVAWQTVSAGLVSKTPSSTPPEVSKIAAAVGRPNVLLIVIDTLRGDVFERVVAETEEGRDFKQALGPAVSFRNMTAAAPWTPPSVGSIMTGLYPREHGFDRVKGLAPGRPLRKLDDSLTTIAEHLQAHGYQTAAIATNPFLNVESGIMQGFERYETLEAGTAKLPLMTALQQASLVPTELYQDAIRVHRRLVPLTDALADDDRPYFLWLHLMDPHMPLRAHDDLGTDDLTEKLPEIDRLYRDETRFTLRELARMFALLKNKGLWENTAVIVVADHGEMMLSDRRFRGRPRDGKKNRRQGHGHALFDELVRVPLVIRPASGATDRRVDALASHVDLAYTVADLVGIGRMQLPANRFSLTPWLTAMSSADPSESRAGAMVGSTHFGALDQRGLRTRRFKLIEYLEGDNPPELYDLSMDSDERKDIADKASGQVDRLLKRLAREWDQMAVAPDTEAVEMDEEERRRLEALGYL